MSALVLLTLVSCFIGTSEIAGRRYDESGACWVSDSFVGENTYWWEYSQGGDQLSGCEHVLHDVGWRMLGSW